MPSRERGGGGRSSLIRTKAGNKVKSKSEAIIDNWLHKNGYEFVYEPEVSINNELFHPDWVVYGQRGTYFRRPIIVEYWGLLRRGNRAGWVHARLPKYIARKEHKEAVYQTSDYDFLGIMPDYVSQLPKFLGRPLKEALNVAKGLCKFYQVQSRYPAQSVLLFSHPHPTDHIHLV